MDVDGLSDNEEEAAQRAQVRAKHAVSGQEEVARDTLYDAAVQQCLSNHGRRVTIVTAPPPGTAQWFAICRIRSLVEALHAALLASADDNNTSALHRLVAPAAARPPWPPRAHVVPWTLSDRAMLTEWERALGLSFIVAYVRPTTLGLLFEWPLVDNEAAMAVHTPVALLVLLQLTLSSSSSSSSRRYFRSELLEPTPEDLVHLQPLLNAPLTYVTTAVVSNELTQ